MSNEMETWFNQQIEERGWSLRETARRLGVSHTTVVKIANGQGGVSVGLCKNIAEVFGITHQEAMRKAGLLPQLPGDEHQQLAQEIMEMLDELPTDTLEEFFRLLRFRVHEEREARKASEVSLDAAPNKT